MTITLNDRTAVYNDIAEILGNAGHSDNVVCFTVAVESPLPVTTAHLT